MDAQKSCVGKKNLHIWVRYFEFPFFALLSDCLLCVHVCDVLATESLLSLVLLALICFFLPGYVVSGQRDTTELENTSCRLAFCQLRRWRAAVAAVLILHLYVYACHTETLRQLLHSFAYWPPGLVHYSCTARSISFAACPFLVARTSLVRHSALRYPCSTSLLSLCFSFSFIFVVSPHRDDFVSHAPPNFLATFSIRFRFRALVW